MSKTVQFSNIITRKLNQKTNNITNDHVKKFVLQDDENSDQSEFTAIIVSGIGNYLFHLTS